LLDWAGIGVIVVYRTYCIDMTLVHLLVTALVMVRGRAE
jgi:hypothetical protein